MDAICIQVKHWLFLNSTSFIQMNDGVWYSALCSNINIHQRPAPLSKSGNYQHLLFKWQTETGARRGATEQRKRWTNQFRFQSGKNTRPPAITLMKNGSSTGPHRHNGCCSEPPPVESSHILLCFKHTGPTLYFLLQVRHGNALFWF